MDAPPRLPDKPTIGQLMQHLHWHDTHKPAIPRTHVKQALWHCLVMNGAASGVTFPTDRVDWVAVEKPDVDGDTPATADGRLWHVIRAEMFHGCLTRIGEEARCATLYRIGSTEHATGTELKHDEVQRQCAEAASEAVGAYLAGCPGSEFTKRVRPW